jgi:hypothetical protein
MLEAEKMGSHQKGLLKLKCLSPLKMRLLGLLFFSPSLVDLVGDLMIFEEKITFSKTSFQMALI